MNGISKLTMYVLPSGQDPELDACQMMFRQFFVCAETPSHREHPCQIENPHLILLRSLSLD